MWRKLRKQQNSLSPRTPGPPQNFSPILAEAAAAVYIEAETVTRNTKRIDLRGSWLRGRASYLSQPAGRRCMRGWQVRGMLGCEGVCVPWCSDLLSLSHYGKSLHYSAQCLSKVLSTHSRPSPAPHPSSHCHQQHPPTNHNQIRRHESPRPPLPPKNKCGNRRRVCGRLGRILAIFLAEIWCPTRRVKSVPLALHPHWWSWWWWWQWL